jgi:hypothetical protein
MTYGRKVTKEDLNKRVKPRVPMEDVLLLHKHHVIKDKKREGNRKMCRKKVKLDE